MQLDSKSKKKQMDIKYSENPYQKFLSNLQSKEDLQGWRNRLVSRLPKLNDVSFIDFGCGLGDKSLALLNKLGSSCREAWLIDFSKSATSNAKQFLKKDARVKVINADAISAIDFIEDKSVGLVILFGFLHELADRKNFLIKLKSKLSSDYLVLLSDNKLYFSPKMLHKEFNECGYTGNCYFKYLSFFKLHFYKSINKKIFKSKLRFSIISGRTDDIVACYKSKDISLKSFPF